MFTRERSRETVLCVGGVGGQLGPAGKQATRKLKNTVEDEFAIGIVRHVSLLPLSPKSIKLAHCEVFRKGQSPIFKNVSSLIIYEKLCPAEC